MRLEIDDGSSGSSSSGGGSTSGGSATPSNSPPKISGNPPNSVNAGSPYDFRPNVSDAEGDRTRCTIKNKPPWASFSGNNCRLYGTPDKRDVGVHGQISIIVSDGESTASLGPFDIEVLKPGNSNVTLSWDIPTRNTDGSRLRDLDSFRIDWVRRNSTARGSIKVNNPGTSTYVIENLSPGTYDFTVVAIDSKGAVSSPSEKATARVD
jgi:hypothetical protein